MRELIAEQPLSNEFIPYYYQIANLLRGKIENGELIAGIKLPKELDLSKHFGVSRVTLRQALAILEKEGLVTRERRKGTFVNRGGVKSKMIQLTGVVWEENAGGEEMRIISIEDVDASSRLQKFFGLDVGEKLTRGSAAENDGENTSLLCDELFARKARERHSARGYSHPQYAPHPQKSTAYTAGQDTTDARSPCRR